MRREQQQSLQNMGRLADERRRLAAAEEATLAHVRAQKLARDLLDARAAGSDEELFRLSRLAAHALCVCWRRAAWGRPWYTKRT